MDECECCGHEIEGLFPIVAAKYDQAGRHAWCGKCWHLGSCQGPYGGACYRYEHEDDDWEETW